MNLTQLVQASNLNIKGFQTSSGSGQSSATQATNNKTSTPLDKANDRIQSQLDSTTAQLSFFGKLKSAVSGVQSAGKALAATTSGSSAKTVRDATSELVDSFNATVFTALNGAAVPGASASDITATRRVIRDLNSALTGNPALNDSLKKIGFKLESDGSLSLDEKKFDAAQKANPSSVQATVAKLGQLMDKTATAELGDSSVVSGSIAKLAQRSTTLKTQASAMQSLVQQMAASSAGTSRQGLAAYLSNSG